MPAGPIIWAVAPPIERALVAAGRAAWAWMTSTEGAVVIGSATATAVAIKGDKAARAKTRLPASDGKVRHHTPAQNAYIFLPPGAGFCHQTWALRYSWTGRLTGSQQAMGKGRAARAL